MIYITALENCIQESTAHIPPYVLVISPWNNTDESSGLSPQEAGVERMDPVIWSKTWRVAHSSSPFALCHVTCEYKFLTGRKSIQRIPTELQCGVACLEPTPKLSILPWILARSLVPVNLSLVEHGLESFAPMAKALQQYSDTCNIAIHCHYFCWPCF